MVTHHSDSTTDGAVNPRKWNRRGKLKSTCPTFEEELFLDRDSYFIDLENEAFINSESSTLKVRRHNSSSIEKTALDQKISELIIQESKKKKELWESIGISAYLDSNRPGPTAKTNKRFLKSIIRDVNDHNKAIIASSTSKLLNSNRDRDEDRNRSKTDDRHRSDIRDLSRIESHDNHRHHGSIDYEKGLLHSEIDKQEKSYKDQESGTSKLVQEPSRSKMDKYFSSDYDPRLDVSLDDITDPSTQLINSENNLDDWNILLDHLRQKNEERKREKEAKKIMKLEKRQRKEERREQRQKRKRKESRRSDGYDSVCSQGRKRDKHLRGTIPDDSDSSQFQKRKGKRKERRKEMKDEDLSVTQKKEEQEEEAVTNIPGRKDVEALSVDYDLNKSTHAQKSGRKQLGLMDIEGYAKSGQIREWDLGKQNPT
ncbi:hypothetical protein BY996DRAFT_8395547 [Phakopsora pachyrhizi]|nr:hypothetical protein BY996DRAFT_8395547 [Phakopsora pachyrhizi]